MQYDMKYTVKSLKADDWNSTKTAPTPTLKLRVRDPFELKESINREKERLAFPNSSERHGLKRLPKSMD